MSPPRTPYALGPFDLISPAARGASAVVWRAIHRTRRAPVAVKIIQPVTAPHQSRVQRLFAHEVRAVARLDHPGIVRIHDFGALPDDTDDPRLPAGAPYLVMEWVDDGTLTEHAGRMGWEALRSTLLGLLDALAHAHARGVVHQDIKSANVLRSARGPVLSDFGVALGVERSLARGSGPVLVGTPDYMAPEQILMQLRRVGPWTDLYALGCLAFELVSGRTPFGARSSFEAFRAHLETPPPPLPLRAGMPRGFADWVAGLLHKDPDRRPRFAAHAAEALRALEERDPSAVSRPRRPIAELPLPGTGRALFALRETGVAGRLAERERLRAALDEVAERRRAALVLIEGPSGVGKSRLAGWLARAAHREGVAPSIRATHAAAGDSAGQGLRSMFADHLRCTGLEGAELIEQLMHRLEDADVAWGLAAALSPSGRFALDGQAVALGSTTELDEALCRVVARLTGPGPLVIVLDDGPWAEGGLRFARHLLAQHPDLPVLVLAPVSLDRVSAAARPLLDALRGHGRVTRLAVGPLSAEQLAGSLRARLRLEEGLLQRIVRRSGGSPVFAEELVRHWLSTDALVERADGLALRAGAGAGVPDDMMALWRARLDEALWPLGEPGLRALEAAAVVGGAVRSAVWQPVARLDRAVLRRAREHLLDRQLAVADPDGGWAFAHPMLREVLLDSARRRGRAAALHRRCAAALAEQGAPPGRIADHHLAAGAPAEAAPLLFESADRRRFVSDYRGMRRDLLRLARVLGALGEGFDAPRRVALRALWADASQSATDGRAAARHARRAVRQAQALGDDRLLVQALLALSATKIRGGRPTDQSDALAVRAARRLGDPELSWRASAALAHRLIRAGRFDEGEPMLGPLLAQAEAEGHLLRCGDLLRLMALVARGRGDFERAQALARRSAALYARSGSRVKQGNGYNLLGDLARYAGDLDGALEAYRRSRHFAELAGDADVVIEELNIGVVLLELDRFSEARRALTAVVQRAERMRFRAVVAYGHLALLVCEARDRRWAAWDARWRLIRAIRSGELVELDAARLAQRAAEAAAEGGAAARAGAAWGLAADQYTRLGQPERAAAAAAAAALGDGSG